MAESISKKRKGAPETTTITKRTKVTPTKGNSKTKTLEVKSTTVKPASTKSSIDASRTAKSSKKSSTTPIASNDDFAGFSSEDEATPSTADQAALLAGFSSDSEAEPTLPAAITSIPPLPTSTDLQKQLKTAASDPDSLPGVIYIGRIPHGFYEPQMKAYFSQFGTITRLRLSRNKLSGRPKHYGFIEFESGAVADIVAKTMDKYLMFGHILQVRRLKDEQVHPELWKGAGRRFKAMPRNQVERGVLERGTGREGWEKRVKKEEKRRKSKEGKLRELGYEFEMPEVRAVESVPRKLEAGEGEKVTIGEDVVEEIAEAVAEAVVDAVAGVAEEVPAIVKAADKADGTTSVGTKRTKGRKEKKTTKKARLST
ncbi:hypothetical protein BDZ85DRAFT_217247 [Elsinoe ampelina]|uniref:RRM domain-containing protein n=1 Tax=Elsinoe ampelina TaxID=302913 RepID=A0A6A6GCT5_9PEZI|nr:hypothetical protein BDZ85DRAFT_217247 [Elsinoe ampelina]